MCLKEGKLKKRGQGRYYQGLWGGGLGDSSDLGIPNLEVTKVMPSVGGMCFIFAFFIKFFFNILYLLGF